MANQAFVMLQKRLQRQLKKMNAPIRDAGQLRALTRIGVLIMNEAKKGATKKKIIDSGRLRASINYVIMQRGKLTEVIVGTSGVPYARINELGGDFTANIEAGYVCKLTSNRKT